MARPAIHKYCPENEMRQSGCSPHTGLGAPGAGPGIAAMCLRPALALDAGGLYICAPPGALSARREPDGRWQQWENGTALAG